MTNTEQDSSAPKLHRQQYTLSQLPTTSVTIYPNRASVVRDIKGVVLKPGRNEIILHQLTPAADENSIKVSGRLTARDERKNKVLLIADMTVDLVKPPVIHPKAESTEETPSTETESADDEDEDNITVSDTETPGLKDLSDKITRLEGYIKTAKEEILSTEKQLHYLENWGVSLTTNKANVPNAELSTKAVTAYLNEYSTKRFELMSCQQARQDEVAAWEKELGKVKKAKAIMVKKLLHKKKKAQEARRRKKEEERERLREEGKEDSTFSDKDPEKWFRVRVWIDREEEETLDAEGELQITYTVTQAGWVSRYDVVISSSGEIDSGAASSNQKPEKPSGYLTYNAHFQNRTFETWKDAMITLSTSQTAFTGLADAAPVLEPWRVQLVNWSLHQRNYHSATNDIAKERAQGGLYSTQEKGYIALEKKQLPEQQHQRRDNDYTSNYRSKAQKKHIAYEHKKSAPAPRQTNFSAPMMSAGAGALPRGRRSEAVVYGGVALDTDLCLEEFEGSIAPPSETYDSDSDSDSGSVADTLTPTLEEKGSSEKAPPKPTFVTQGLTSSYAIPHPMTIPSSHTASADLSSVSGAVRRHTILTLPLTHIHLSYVSAPKLRAAAYLKARIWNTSTVTLRKGAVGITLDGTFIGSTTLSRAVYPGSVFSFPLGIDESVSVNYAKPTVKRNLQRSMGAGKLFSVASWGLGHQEMVATYGRSIVIRNNRLDRGPIELVIADQVPVSEDGKLVIVVTWPKGLKPPPPPVTAGGKRFVEEGEIAEDNGEGGEEGASLKLGNPVRTGTGVYMEGFQTTGGEGAEPAVVRTATSSSPHGLGNTPLTVLTPPPARSEDDNTSGYSGSVSKLKRGSFFGSLSGKNKPGSSTTESPTGHSAKLPVTSGSGTGGSGAVGGNIKRSNTSDIKNVGTVAAALAFTGPEEKWGMAVAAMRRNGEVIWKVKLNPGMGVRLGLEYECRVPAGEVIAGL